MFQAYLRLVLFVAGLAGAVILFAFAFTAAAVVVLVALLVLAIFGRGPRIQWTVVRRSTLEREQRPPPVIDHDPNDLPRR
jgi:hypothetical protein